MIATKSNVGKQQQYEMNDDVGSDTKLYKTKDLIQNDH